MKNPNVIDDNLIRIISDSDEVEQDDIDTDIYDLCDIPEESDGEYYNVEDCYISS
jgi:hypothetical protein